MLSAMVPRSPSPKQPSVGAFKKAKFDVAFDPVGGEPVGCCCGLVDVGQGPGVRDPVVGIPNIFPIHIPYSYSLMDFKGQKHTNMG